MRMANSPAVASTPVTAPPAGRIGYLVRAFPRVSETFIINEIIELERQGFDLRIYSMIAPTDRIRHRLVDQIRSPIRYLPNLYSAGFVRIVADHLALAVRSPRTYWSAVVRLIASCEPDLIARLAQAPSLARLMAADGVVLLHAGFVHAPGSLAYAASLFAGLPYTVAAHARDLYRSPRSLLLTKLAGARAVFTCTRYNAVHLQQLAAGAAPIRVVHVYHGTSLERFPFGPYGSSAPPLVLAVARLVEKKGLDDLIHAAAVLRDSGRRFSCHIVGDGQRRTSLQRLIEALDLEQFVTLDGAVDQDDVVGWYRRATVLVLPCRVARDGDRDGIPNALIEAAACGVPIVTTPVSGIPELVEHRRSGLLVPPGNPGELARAIDLLLHSADLREQLRTGARKIVEEAFDLRRNAVTIGRELCAIVGESVDGGAPVQFGRRGLLGAWLRWRTAAPTKARSRRRPIL